ncbi:hypothetical protein Tco_0130662, partial [Tanacetum coccineum]
MISSCSRDVESSRSDLSRLRLDDIVNFLTPLLDRSRRHCFMLATPSPRSVFTILQEIWCRLEKDVHGMRGALGEQREVLDSMASDFSRLTTWTVTRLSRMMDQAGF